MSEAPAKRYISTQQAAFIGVAAMVGAGIFSLLGAAGEVAGAAVWLSFLLAGGIAALQGYSFAKLGAKFPSAGGLLEYVNQGFGDGHVATVVAWLTYIANGIVTAMVALSFGSYASSAFAGDNAAWVKIFAVALLVTMTILNIAGSSVVARVQSLVVFVVIGILAFFSAGDDREHRAGQPRAVDISRSPGHRVERRADVLRLPRLRCRDVHGQGSRQPARSSCRAAMTIAIGLATVIYVAVSIGVFGTLSVPEVIAAGPTAIAVAAQPVLGDAGYWLMTVTALFATAGATNSGLYPATGLSDHLASSGQFPTVMARRLGGRAPFGLIILAAAIIIVVVAFDLSAVASIGSAVALVIFAVVTLGPPAHPRRHRCAPQHRAPGPGRRDHHARDVHRDHAHPRARLDGDPGRDPGHQHRARRRVVAPTGTGPAGEDDDHPATDVPRPVEGGPA